MVRRPRGVRIRYVAFQIEPAVSRAAFADAVRSACEDIAGPVPTEIVVFRGGGGLVRCGHRQKESVIVALNGITKVGATAAVVRTIGTSGTIRKATEKYLASKTETAR